MTRTKKITPGVLAGVLAVIAMGATTAYAFGPEGGHRGMSQHGGGMHGGMSQHGGGMHDGMSRYGGGMQGGMHGGMSRHGGGMHSGMQSGMRGGKKLFKKLDADKDGIVTRQEAETGRDKHFATMDKDSDGVVSVAEIDAIIEKRLRRMQIRMRYKMLARLDSNGDGQVDKQEFDKKTMAMFERADADGDGNITRKEARRMHRGRGMRRGMKRRGFGHQNYYGKRDYKQGRQKSMQSN